MSVCNITFRTSEWPTDPAPVAGEPIVEYLSRRELIARGWTVRLIEEFLGGPDGTRKLLVGGGLCSNFKFYYRLDRVLATEQTEEFRAELRRRRAARGRGSEVASLVSTERPPLALTKSQLRGRGWTDVLIRGLLGEPDSAQPSKRGGSLEPLYAADRVQEVEATASFQKAWARREARRAARAERTDGQAARRAAELKEAQWVKARREEARRAAFPGFWLSLQFGQSGESVCIGIGVDDGPNTSAHVRNADGYALAQGCEKAYFWAPLIDWLLEHEEVGNPRFRAALGFLTAGDTEGWRAWDKAHRLESAA